MERLHWGPIRSVLENRWEFSVIRQTEMEVNNNELDMLSLLVVWETVGSIKKGCLGCLTFPM